MDLQPAKLLVRTNLVVCDIDGVLTSMEPDGGSYINHEPEDYHISDTCYDRLIRICDQNKAKVLISSNWRRFPKGGYYDFHGKGKKYYSQLDKLAERLGKKYYFGDLPHDRHLTKSQALELWFEHNPEFRKRFVIFDDDPREGFASSRYAKHYIETDVKTGISEDDIKKAKKIFDRG